MTTKCIDQTALEFVGGGSDKLYVAQIQATEIRPGSVEYRAVGYYGRRGSSLNQTQKYAGPSEPAARAAYNRLVSEKTGKGYTLMSTPAGTAVTGMPSTAPVPGTAGVGGSPAAPFKGAKAKVGILPMLATPITEAIAETYLEDDEWVVQRKYDGERVLVSLRRSGITATNRKGEARPLTSGAEAELKKLLSQTDFSDERETVLDGELMGDSYVAYDIVTLRDNDMRDLDFVERYTALEELLTLNLGLLAPVAWSTAEKLAMKATAELEDWEGLIFRSCSGLYASGVKSQLAKFKLWATCTCRVLTVNEKRSIQVAVRDEKDEEAFIGNVTVPVNQDVPEADDLVEVRYLYVMEGGSLYQPSLLSIRTDIDDADLRSSLRPAPPEKRGVAVAA